MKLPEGVGETEFLEAAERVINLLAKKFRFGYHEISDMKQQGMLFAIDVIANGKYNTGRPLENFLYTHLRNRFINYKRDNYMRNDPPCLTCPFYDPKKLKSKNQCSVFEDKNECGKLSDWNRRNHMKKSIASPVDVAGITDASLQKTNDVSLNFELEELEAFIDERLPLSMRADYLRLKADQPVPKFRKQQVRAAVTEIIEEYRNAEDEDW